MKLKESTFAVIAEKQGSISHKWIYGNPDIYWYWNKGCYYEYDKGKVRYFNPKANEYPDKDIPIYTESEFEALLKAEQENEAKPTISNNGESTNIVYSDFKAKPPIGLTPRMIWLEMRYNDILDAMTRYHSERKEIPLEWIGELLRLRTENEI